MVIARSNKYKTKVNIIQEAYRRRRKLFYLGKLVAIFEDCCPEIMEQQTAYKEVVSPLYQQGLKPSLLYPARLQIYNQGWRGNVLHFSERC